MGLVLLPEGPDNRYDRLGDVTSGSWSTQVDFTPHSIGSSDGGTGSVSFTATATDESDFTFARDIDVNYSYTGKINSLTLGSGLAQLQSDTLLSRLNTTKTFGPFYQWDQVYSYNNQHQPQSGEAYLHGFDVINETAYWSNIQTDFGNGTTSQIMDIPTGSGAGQFSGSVGPSTTVRGGVSNPLNPIVNYIIDIGNNKVIRLNQGTFDIEFGNGVFTNPVSITVDPDGNAYVADNGTSSIVANRITKFDSTGAQVAQWSLAGSVQVKAIAAYSIYQTPYLYALNNNTLYQIDLNTGAILLTQPLFVDGLMIVQEPQIAVYETAVYIVGYTVNSAGAWDGKQISTYSTYDLLPLSTRYAMPLASNPGGTGVIIQGVSVGGGYQGGVVWVSEGLYSSTGQTGQVITGYVTQDGVTLSNAFYRYLSSAIPAPYSYFFFAQDRYNVAYPGWTGSVWDYIKQLTAATDTQLYASGNSITVTPAAGRNIYNIDNIISGENAKITANVTGLSRKIKVVSQNSQYSYQGNGDIFYDAYADGNNVISIDVGQTSIVKVSTTNWPVGLDQLVVGVNYTVQDSNNLDVNGSAWTAAGGSIRASVDADGQSINLSVVGPIYAIAGYQGPFTISKDANGTASLQVTGWGVLSKKQDITLYTGAAEEFVSQDIGETLDNIFIENVEQAYDRGAWAAFDAAGPSIQLTFSVASSNFNWSYGDRIYYRDQNWRVVSYSNSVGKTSVTSVPYTTVDDAHEIWRSSTVAQYDFFWQQEHGRWGGDYRVYDKKFRPLWNPLSLGPAERQWIVLDSDLVPFFQSGGPGASTQWISIDTDGVPFYSTTRDSYSTWTDIDGRPYYGIG